MSFIREVPAVVVPVTDPVQGYTHVAVMAHGTVLLLVTGSGTTGLVFCLGTICYPITTLLHRNASARNLKIFLKLKDRPNAKSNNDI